jgi:trehalose 6-phosphate phosphatase
MKDILSPANTPVLRQLAWSNMLLALDYDGTLAPIVADPDKARMRDDTRGLLERIARAYPCIVISGRSQEDVLRRVRGTGVFEVIGNHGLEPWRRTDSFASQVHGWIPLLRARLDGMEGVVIEDKSFSVALHYRRAASRKRALAAIARAAGELDGVRVIGGKCVVNLIPRGAPHKGTALEIAREHLRCDVAMYVGDDETDEDVFALDDPGRLLTVRVGADVTSRAAFFLKNQACVDVLLERMLELRQERRVAR